MSMTYIVPHYWSAPLDYKYQLSNRFKILSSFSNKKKVLECVIDAGDLMGWPLRKVL